MLLLTGCAVASPPDDDTTAIDDKPNITVVGTAAATVTPDEAQTRLRRNDGQPSAAEAWDQTRRTSHALVDAPERQDKCHLTSRRPA